MLEQLDGMSEQGRMERLANSAHDEGALSGYVEDIRDALIDYQVHPYRVGPLLKNSVLTAAIK